MVINLNLKNDNGRSVIMELAKEKNIKSIRLLKVLIDHGANIDLVDNDGVSALMHACDYANIDAINLLLDNNANTNIVDNNGYTALMYLICTIGRNEMDGPDDCDLLVNIILKSSLTITHKNKNGDTAYDIYRFFNLKLLDKYHLQLLKGVISINNVKSARSKKN